MKTTFKRFRYVMVLCLTMLISITAATIAGGAQYPWEEDEAGKAAPAEAKPPAMEKSDWIHVGPFSFRSSKKVMRHHDNDLGDMMLLTNDNAEVLAAIQFDEEPFGEVADREQMEMYITKNVPYQKKGRMNVAGSSSLVLAEIGDDETLFHIFPADDFFMYSLLIIYDKRTERLSPEVRELLSTLKISSKR